MRVQSDLMFLSREIDITDHIQQIHNQSENGDIPEKPNRSLGFLQLLFLFLIAFSLYPLLFLLHSPLNGLVPVYK